MNGNEIRILTDTIYTALFGMDTKALLRHYGLPQNAIKDDQDDLLRDSMTIEALQALNDVETAVTRSMLFFEDLPVTFEILQNTTRLVAEMAALEAKAAGIEFLQASRLRRRGDEC